MVKKTTKKEVQDETPKKVVGKTYGVTDASSAPTADTMDYNGATNAQEYSDEDKTKLEEELSREGIVARVITATGNYMKVKFFRDGKPFAVYKGKSGSKEGAQSFLDETLQRDKEVNS
jgi:dipeptidyl aminopeptidase/acylaminoacyl peptidase